VEGVLGAAIADLGRADHGSPAPRGLSWLRG
jgi:hypothetical protein